MNDELKKEITELIRDLQSPDSIELGDSKGRIKVYVNFGNETEAKAKIETAIKLLKEKKEEAL